MKFYKASILAIMISAAALFACSEQPGQDGRAAQETDEQPRAYFGDEDKKDVDNQQDGMNTQKDVDNQRDGMNTQNDADRVNQPQVQQPPQGSGAGQQPPQQDRQ